MANPYESEELSTESDSGGGVLDRIRRIVPSSGGDESLQFANKERGSPSFMKSMFYGFKPESGQEPAAEPARSGEPAESAPSGDRTAMMEALRALQRTRRRQPVIPEGTYPEKQPAEGAGASDAEYAPEDPPAGEGRSYPPAGADEDVRRMGFAPATITGSRAASKSDPASESATKTPAMEGAGGDEPSVLPGYGLPYLVSRMTEQMRTAGTGGTRDYSAAQHILNLRAQSEQAPILAEQRRRAEEDRMTKQKLDAAKVMLLQKKFETEGKSKELSPEESRLKSAQASQLEDKVRHASEEREAATSQRLDRSARQLQGDANALSKRLEKYAGLYQSLVAFNQSYPGLVAGNESGELPELTIADRIKAKIGWTSGLSDEKEKLVTMAKDFRDKVEKARTGASARGEETGTYDTILGMGAFTSPDQLARGIKMFADEVRAKINTVYQGFSPQVQGIYEKNADPDYVVLRNSPVFVSQTPKTQKQPEALVRESVSSRVSGRDEFPPYPTSVKQGQAVLVREKGALPHEAQWIEKSALKGLFASDDDLEFVRPQDEIEFRQSAQ